MPDELTSAKHVVALAADTYTATTEGPAIDLSDVATLGYEALTFTIQTGAFSTFSGTNKWTFTVEESDDSEGPWTEIPALDYIGAKRSDHTAWDRVCDAAGDAAAVFSLGVRVPGANRRRYKRLVLAEEGTVSAIASGTARLGHPRKVA